MKSRSPATRLLFASSVHDAALLAAVGTEADGLGGVHRAPDPSSNFAAAFTLHSGHRLPENGASAYDAIALLERELNPHHPLIRLCVHETARLVLPGWP